MKFVGDIKNRACISAQALPVRQCSKIGYNNATTSNIPTIHLHIPVLYALRSVLKIGNSNDAGFLMNMIVKVERAVYHASLVPLHSITGPIKKDVVHFKSCRGRPIQSFTESMIKELDLVECIEVRGYPLHNPCLTIVSIQTPRKEIEGGLCQTVFSCVPRLN